MPCANTNLNAEHIAVYSHRHNIEERDEARYARLQRFQQSMHHAPAMNRAHGDRRRLYLSQLVERFRAGLRRIDLATQRGLFPMRTLDPVEGVSAETLHLHLLRRGIRTVLVRCCHGLGTRLAFLITALHRPAEIDRVIEALEGAVSGRAIKLSVRAS